MRNIWHLARRKMSKKLSPGSFKTQATAENGCKCGFWWWRLVAVFFVAAERLFLWLCGAPSTTTHWSNCLFCAHCSFISRACHEKWEFLPGFSFILQNSNKWQTFWDLLNYWGCLLLHGCGDFYKTKKGHLDFLNKSQYIWFALFTSLIQ